MNILKKHLTNNVVINKNKYYLQKKGIPQGSILSSLLCCLYYTKLENEYIIPSLPSNNKSLLIRLADDYLCISNNIDYINTFYNKITNLKEYGCVINESKTKSNIIINQDEFTWCGLIININTLSIRNDYNKYLNVHPNYIVSKKYSNNSRDMIINRLLFFYKPKCYGMIIDPFINSKDVILVYYNIYRQIFMNYFYFVELNFIIL